MMVQADAFNAFMVMVEAETLDNSYR